MPEKAYKLTQIIARPPKTHGALLRREPIEASQKDLINTTSNHEAVERENTQLAHTCSHQSFFLLIIYC